MHLLEVAQEKIKPNDRDQAHTKTEKPEAAGRSSPTPEEEQDGVLQSGGQSYHTSRPAGRVGLWGSVCCERSVWKYLTFLDRRRQQQQAEGEE